MVYGFVEIVVCFLFPNICDGIENTQQVGKNHKLLQIMRNYFSITFFFGLKFILFREMHNTFTIGRQEYYA